MFSFKQSRFAVKMPSIEELVDQIAQVTYIKPKNLTWI